MLCIGRRSRDEATELNSAEKKHEEGHIIHVTNKCGFLPKNDTNDDESISNQSSEIPCVNYVFHDDREFMLRNRQNPFNPYELLQNFERGVLSSKSCDPLVTEVQMIKELIKQSNRKSSIEDEWTQLAKVLDRLCFFIFLGVFSMTSFVMLLPAYLMSDSSGHLSSALYH